MCSLAARTCSSKRSRVWFDVNSSALRPSRRDVRQVALELALEELDLRARELIQRLEVVVGRDARVGDDQDAVLHVIEREHRVEQHEAGLVRAVGAAPRSPSTGSNHDAAP